MKQPEKLQYYREREGMSVCELAEKLHLTAQSIIRWEKGRNEPTADNLKRLSKLYGISVDELLSEDEPCTEEPVVEVAEEQPANLPAEKPLEQLEEKPVAPETTNPAVTIQKLPLRYKIALCSAVALCVLFAAMFTVNKLKQAEDNPEHDIHVTQDEMDVKDSTSDPDLGFDLILIDE